MICNFPVSIRNNNDFIFSHHLIINQNNFILQAIQYENVNAPHVNNWFIHLFDKNNDSNRQNLVKYYNIHIQFHYFVNIRKMF